MGFKKVVLPPKEACNCKKPNSKEGKFFGPGTIWVCDICGAAWEFVKARYWSDQRDNDHGYIDEWRRNSLHDGLDNREHPEVAKVEVPVVQCRCPNPQHHKYGCRHWQLVGGVKD